MWEQIVMNLLSNALKFTFEGGITVALRDSTMGVTLEVADTGVGIAPHDMPQLFQRFHRVEGARGRTHEGSGIGLAMVHELVRLHGGRVDAVSAPGVGTTFTVDLPRGAAHLPADHVIESTRPAAPVMASMFTDEALRWMALPGPTDPALSEPSPVTASRVLVVDDNADMRAYLTRLLRSRWSVRAVATADAALEAILAEPPDLILTDVMMPGRDGLAFVRSLREQPDTADIPVIAVSARAGEEARLEGLRSGADEYLVKPFSPRELLVRVEARICDGAEHARASRAARTRAPGAGGGRAAEAASPRPVHAGAHAHRRAARATLRRRAGERRHLPRLGQTASIDCRPPAARRAGGSGPAVARAVAR